MYSLRYWYLCECYGSERLSRVRHLRSRVLLWNWLRCCWRDRQSCVYYLRCGHIQCCGQLCYVYELRSRDVSIYYWQDCVHRLYDLCSGVLLWYWLLCGRSCSQSCVYSVCSRLLQRCRQYCRMHCLCGG